METVKIRTPQSLLRLLPRLVGQVDAPALVALPFSGGRSGMPMVLDLPALGSGRDDASDDPGEEALLDAVVRAIASGGLGADAVVLIACLGAPLGGRALPLQRELLGIAERLDARGVRALEVLALAPDAWGDYARPDAPRGPLAELDLLDDPAPGVPEPAAAPGVPSGDGGTAARAVLTWLASLEQHDLDAVDADPVGALEFAVSLAHRLGDGPSGLGVDPARAAALAILLVESPAIRDLAIELAIDGVDAGVATLAAGASGDAQAGAAAADRFLGTGPAPDPDRLLDRLRRWTAIAEAAPLEARAPLLVIVGFLHFFVGRGRTAARCAELAMALDPLLTMAPLLRDVVDAKGAPDWVLRSGDA
ncbi:hypothetical protein [Agrococcus carbonis]|uniref:DUF4192 domain-containing protein n=1 Tax=Agrococcus carbonis TaxID=684552 RepID=A0A1H1S9B4_9MICO|nr:hypothetical protein [Agrococcus carbonis]SDS44565.1 hypothetical protein SAMN04489719_2339 [Agrococcus carbonis]